MSVVNIEFCVSRELCECVKDLVETNFIDIKALVVAFSFHFINTKMFPFPTYDLCEYQSFIIRFLDH